MDRAIGQIIKEDAKNVHLLIVEDDFVMQELYHRIFDGLFEKFVIKDNGVDAYEYYKKQSYSPVDLIITDTHMPQMDGIELVEKIRKKDFDVHIIVMTIEKDFNIMKSYVLNGVDAILPKPYDEKITMKVMQRTLHKISEKKLLELYIDQLELMAKESVALKSAALKKRIGQERVPKLKKNFQEKGLKDKYKIRESIHHMEDVDVEELDTFGREKIDTFRENIANYEQALCSVEVSNDMNALRTAVTEVLDGLFTLVQALNVLGAFPVAANAAIHLVKFMASLDDSVFQDSAKRTLFIDILLAMLGDFDKWIDTVFVSRTANNIHYFDASFANTCLELEMVFKTESVKEEADSLEFF